MLSVIIPTLNEGRRIVTLVQNLMNLPGVGEVVIVDASDQDESLQALRQVQRSELVSVITSNRRGRAAQMNLGAESCTCETLLFLHSDTELPQNCCELIDEQLSKAKWGRFDVRLDHPGIQFRFIETMINIRSRLTNLATGDQAIFVEQKLFIDHGGFAEIALMEDVEFSRRLSRRWPPALIKTPVTTSARRWIARGTLKTILLMWKLRLLYRLGVDPDKLALMYQDVK